MDRVIFSLCVCVCVCVCELYNALQIIYQFTEESHNAVQDTIHGPLQKKKRSTPKMNN